MKENIVIATRGEILQSQSVTLVDWFARAFVQIVNIRHCVASEQIQDFYCNPVFLREVGDPFQYFTVGGALRQWNFIRGRLVVYYNIIALGLN